SSADTNMTNSEGSQPPPSVTTTDVKNRAQPWRDIVSNQYWAEPCSFKSVANKGPRPDIRLLEEIDAISR
ncbi:hypothetical protein QBC38DRAFT_350275, partial [Podospora fimiseda]